MDPTSACCPNLDCPTRGQTGQGSMGIHLWQDQHVRCRQCRKTVVVTHTGLPSSGYARRPRR
jgi:hypothetical protein